MGENLYQLTSRIKNLQPGMPFDVNGPHDTTGYVVKRVEEREKEALYLVRGTGHRGKS